MRQHKILYEHVGAELQAFRPGLLASIEDEMLFESIEDAAFAFEKRASPGFAGSRRPEKLS